MAVELQAFLQTCLQRAKDTQRELPVNFNDAREYYTGSKRLFVDFCEQLRPVLVPIMEFAQRKHDRLRHTYFFQLRLGQPYTNEERDKKMYGFFKKFL